MWIEAKKPSVGRRMISCRAAASVHPLCVCGGVAACAMDVCMRDEERSSWARVTLPGSIRLACAASCLTLLASMPSARTKSKRRGNVRKPDATVPSPPDSEARKKSWKTRVFWSWVMTIYALTMFFCTRQIGCMATLFLIQVVCYYELVKLGCNEKYEKQLPGFRRFYYYWFFTFAFWSWGWALKPHLMKESFTDVFGHSLQPLLENFEIISYSLYVVGIVAFVFSLDNKELFQYQFKQFGYCHCALLLIVVQGTFNVANLFNGIMWVLFPMSLIVCNDCFAYIFGFTLGKTPLIKLSPKKTWEGFIGGAAATIVHAILFSRFLSDPLYDPLYQSGLVSTPFIQPIMTCEPRGVFVESFSFQPPSCEMKALYIPRQVCKEDFPMANSLASIVGLHDVLCQHVSWSPVQTHGLAYALFASLVAPFAGFFASGFKRAINAKDFGSLFPGHGGMMDRFDCHMLMASFGYFYFTYVVS